MNTVSQHNLHWALSLPGKVFALSVFLSASISAIGSSANAQTSMFGFDPDAPAPTAMKKFELVERALGQHGPASPGGEWSFTVQFSDAMYFVLPDITGGLQPSEEDLKRSPGSSSLGAPSTDRRFDWRDQNKVTPVRSQGRCGSCWAFGALGAFEGSYLKINNGDPKGLDFSEQNLLNCTPYSSCGGGYHDKAADRLKTNGVDAEKDEQYRATEQSCRGGSFSYKADNWGYVDKASFIPSQDKIKVALKEHGPLAVAMQATANFQGYRSGVFNEKISGQATNHVVTLVGWNDDLGAWIIKNSWGTNWGQNAGVGTETDRGYAYVAYGAANLGAYALYIDAAKASPGFHIATTTALKLKAGQATGEAPMRILPVNAQVDEAARNEARKVPVNGQLTVSLRQQPGQGYIFRPAPFNTNLLRLVSEQTTPAPGNEPGRSGGDDIATWVFQALKVGATVLTFNMTGPGGEVVETIRYAVEVEQPPL